MTPPSFSRSKTTYFSTAIRLALLLLSVFENDLSRMIKNVVFMSVVVDPVITFRHVREALAIQNLLVQSNDSFIQSYLHAYTFPNTIHLPPLILALFEPLLCYMPASGRFARPILGLLLISVDFLVARSLEALGQAAIYRLDATNRWEQSLQQSIPDALRVPLVLFEERSKIEADKNNEVTVPLLRIDDLPRTIAQLYYSSPVIMISAMGGSFQNLKTLLLVQALLQSALSTGSLVLSSWWLALAAYLDIHAAVMLIPVAAWMGRRSKNRPWAALMYFVCFSLALQGLSLLLVGIDRYLDVIMATHLHSFSFVNMQPSLSTLWYLSMELFGRFRMYFTFLLGGVPYILILPLTLRLWRYPFVLVAILSTLGTLFRPPCTLYSLNVAVCFAAMSPCSLAYMQQNICIVLICAIPVPIILYMVCYWLWIDSGVGEANFVYFQCLAFNVFVGMLLIEFCSASLRRDKTFRLTERLSKVE